MTVFLIIRQCFYEALKSTNYWIWKGQIHLSNPVSGLLGALVPFADQISFEFGENRSRPLRDIKSWFFGKAQ